MRKPFYKISHQAWYCQLPGVKRDGSPTRYKNTLLVRGPKAETKEAAEKKYHELMAARPATRKSHNPGEILVKHLIDDSWFGRQSIDRGALTSGTTAIYKASGATWRPTTRRRSRLTT